MIKYLKFISLWLSNAQETKLYIKHWWHKFRHGSIVPMALWLTSVERALWKHKTLDHSRSFACLEWDTRARHKLRGVTGSSVPVRHPTHPVLCHSRWGVWNPMPTPLPTQGESSSSSSSPPPPSSSAAAGLCTAWALECKCVRQAYKNYFRSWVPLLLF